MDDMTLAVRAMGGLACIMGALATPPGASAQTLAPENPGNAGLLNEPGVTVASRERPDYARLGVRLGSGELLEDILRSAQNASLDVQHRRGHVRDPIGAQIIGLGSSGEVHRYSGLGWMKSNRSPSSQALRWFPYAGMPPARWIIAARCMRFHVMNVVLRLVKSFSGPPDPGSR